MHARKRYFTSYTCTRRKCLKHRYCHPFHLYQHTLLTMINRGSGKSSPQSVTPIDEDEQSKIAEELKQEAVKQALSTRSVFRYIFLVVALILFVCLLYSVFSPWEMDHQKLFQDILPIYGFFSYYCGSIYCYIIASMIVQSTQRVHAILLNLAYFIAAFSMIAWGVVFNNYGVNNPLLFWLPLSNVVGILLAQYVDRDTADLVKSVEGLEQYKYNFKAV